MTLALGIDGGGTKTRCLILDEQGNVRGTAISGASKPDAVDLDTGRANLQQALLAASQDCGGIDVVDTMFFGIGGVISDADQQVIMRMLDGLPLRPAVPIGIDHDIRVALAGGAAGQPGIALIAGTGSSSYGRNQAGDSWRSGGWGYLIDDLGSGYFLGQQALTAIVRAQDGRGPETALVAPILNALGLHNINELMHRIYHPYPDYASIGALAPIVTALAEDDAIARGIIDHGCNELAAMVLATALNLQLPDDVIVIPVGSLASSSVLFRRTLYRAIIQVLPKAQVKPPIAPPVAGAAFLALQQVGITLTEDVLAKLPSID